MGWKSFEELKSWQLSRNFASKIYMITSQNIFKDIDLQRQLRRATVSISSNIAEGFERNTDKEFIHFLFIAKGSAGEARSQLYIALDLKFIAEVQFKEMNESATEISKLISGLIKYLHTSNLSGTPYGVRHSTLRLIKMVLKEKLLSSFLAFEQKVDIESDLHDVRNEALKVFENKGFPTKQEEAWKYTSLNAVLANDYNILPKHETDVDWKDVQKYFLNDVDPYKVVFINGVFSSHLSSTTHDGLDVCLVSSALTKPKYKIVIDTYFNQAGDKEDSFTNLNTACAFEGAYINIPKST